MLNFSYFKLYVKWSLLIFLAGSGFFIILKNIDTIDSINFEGDISNNYGVDCKEHRRLMEEKNGEDLYKKFQDTTLIEKTGLEYTTWDTFQNKWVHVKQNISLKRRPLLNCLDSDDPYLAHVIKRDMIELPNSRKQKTYFLVDSKSTELESNPQALDVMEMVYKRKLKNGFFVEAGAADCEFSVSLPLEIKFGWTGILIEPHQDAYEDCQKVGRKSYLINCCLGTQTTPHFVNFNFISAGQDKHTNQTVMAGMSGDKAGTNLPLGQFQIQCFPLESILLALNNPTVNLFILDIEGFELAVLRAIDWNKVNIEVLTVEVEHAGHIMKDSSPEIIEEFMKSKGYKRFLHRNRIHYKTKEQLDHLYVRNDIVQKYNVVQL